MAISDEALAGLIGTAIGGVIGASAALLAEWLRRRWDEHNLREKVRHG